MTAMTQTLADFFGTEKLGFSLMNPCDFAHVVVDVQREFCDPEYGDRGTAETDRIAGHIADVANAFRAACVPTYLVYSTVRWVNSGCMIHDTSPESSCGGFHKVRAAPGDVLVGKRYDSAFIGSDMQDIFERNAVKGLIVSGFNLSACVRRTVNDACEAGYSVVVMKDCVGNDKPASHYDSRPHIAEMMGKGAKFASSGPLLGAIRAMKAYRTAFPPAV